MIAGDQACVGCLRGRLYQMRAVVRVRVAAEVRPGDLIVVDGQAPQVFRGICQECEVGQEGFEALLERIRNQEHPAYGALSWDGRSREITETVQFEGNVGEADDVVRARALRYLEGLNEAERAAAEIDIVFREKRPVRAIVRAQTSELSPARLRELKERAGLK